MIDDTSSMDRHVERRRTGRYLALGVLLVLLGGGGYSLYPSLSRWASSDRSVDRSRLRFGEVTRGDLLRDVSVEGRIVAAAQPTLVSPARGTVPLLARAGDRVRRGQVLARIDSPELGNLVQQEEAMLESLESELQRQRILAEQTRLQNEQRVALSEVRLKAAERALERSRRLFEEGLVNSIDYEKAQDDARVALLELESAREDLLLERETMDFEIQNRRLQLEKQRLVVEELRRKLAELSVVSPVDGLLGRVDVKDKDTVQSAQPLFSVVDLSEYQMEVLIPENFVSEIGPGTPALILYEGREYPGRVHSLSPQVEASQVEGIVAFTEDPPPGLKQNQRVHSRLILDSRPGVLKVPRGPFLESMGGRQVYVVEGEVALLRPIQAGAISVTEVEVVSELEEGEQIILSDLSRYQGARQILLR